MPRVRVNGVPLHYERGGSGEPLLLITGFTISSAVFEPVLELYGGRFDCITYDNRGSGRSGAPLKPDLDGGAGGRRRRACCEAIGVESAHVCGLSMGGMIAQELAIRFPERVRGLVLGGTTPGGPRAARPTLKELGALGGAAAGGWRDGQRSWLGEWVFSDEFRREQPERARELLRHFGRHRATPQGVWAHWWASVYHDTTSRLGEHPGADARDARRARRDGADLQRPAARRPDPGRRAVHRARLRPRLHARAPAGVVRAADGVAGPARPDRRRARRAPAPPRAPSRSRARSACRSARPGRARAWPG